MPRVVAAALVLLVACAGPRPGAPVRPQGTGEGQVWEANALVLEDASHGPKLCLGGIATSDPPQCGDIDIANWDWDRVEGEERKSGTIYGEYRVHGTLEGETFTVTEYLGEAVYEEEVFDDDEFKAPCPEPEGGWAVPDPERTTEEDLGRTVEFAESQPDSADFWIDQPPKEFLTPEERASIVVTALFTGDLERHRKELRAYWGGPLCVALGRPSEDELSRVREEVEGPVADELGLIIVGSYTERGQVVLEVAVADPAAQETLDARYGEGVFRLEGALEPVASA